jgi:hypothetical protein
MPLLLEIHYLPCIQYFSKFYVNDGIIVVDDLESAQKQSYRNRCRIAGANRVIDLSVPMHDSRGRLLIKDVKIDNHGNWQSQHWKSIKSAYGKSAFFEHYAHRLAPIYEKPVSRLFDFNMELMHILLKILKIDPFRTELLSGTNEKELVSFKNKIHPKLKFRAEDPDFNIVPYHQPFEQKLGFLPNLSIIDLIFNEGPEAGSILSTNRSK